MHTRTCGYVMESTRETLGLGSVVETCPAGGTTAFRAWVHPRQDYLHMSREPATRPHFTTMFAWSVNIRASFQNLGPVLHSKPNTKATCSSKARVRNALCMLWRSCSDGEARNLDHTCRLQLLLNRLDHGRLDNVGSAQTRAHVPASSARYPSISATTGASSTKFARPAFIARFRAKQGDVSYRFVHFDQIWRQFAQFRAIPAKFRASYANGPRNGQAPPSLLPTKIFASADPRRGTLLRATRAASQTHPPPFSGLTEPRAPDNPNARNMPLVCS